MPKPPTDRHADRSVEIGGDWIRTSDLVVPKHFWRHAEKPKRSCVIVVYTISDAFVNVLKQNAIVAIYSGTRAPQTVRTGLGEQRAPRAGPLVIMDAAAGLGALGASFC